MLGWNHVKNIKYHVKDLKNSTEQSPDGQDGILQTAKE